MVPRILPRAEHTISRKEIDPEALKVLYRLKNQGFKAYLVGGGVRDLLLGRRPKDFDISTNAHPQQVKRLFRYCFIVGRRFRLCHVRFGRKVVEVATFRKQSQPEEGDTLVRRDNTFGTPEEDAFRRDFTVNALFYDIATFSVIDYVGGLEDLHGKLIRTIGDPAVRFREDPVRMLRAVALAARLEFTIDRDTVEAIRFLRGEILKSSSARILEEFYKILRQGASRKTFELLHDLGLLAYLFPEASTAITQGGGALLSSLERLDRYRSGESPDGLTNPLLVGTLLVPLGLPLRRVQAAPTPGETTLEETEDIAGELESLGVTEEPPGPPTHLALPFARKDLDRMRLVLAAQNRLNVPPVSGVKRLLASRGYLDEALRWMEIHGGASQPELAREWRALEVGGAPLESPSARRRPRRRRRRRARGEESQPEVPLGPGTVEARGPDKSGS